jgi:hypothetical protein
MCFGFLYQFLDVRSTGIDRLAKSRLIIFDRHGVSGRKRDDLLTEILRMVGRKPTGLYHYDQLFPTKEARKGANKISL